MQEIDPLLTGTPFAFLTDPTWITMPDAAANYVTLIGHQDSFFDIVRGHILTKLELTTTSTDTEILAKVRSMLEKERGTILEILKAAVATVCLVEYTRFVNDSCAPGIKSKFNDLFTTESSMITSSKITNEHRLARLLLFPALYRNITMRALVEIIQTLRNDSETMRLINVSSKVARQPPVDSIADVFLMDKYATYIVSCAYGLTSQEAYDYAYLWGCAHKGFTDWMSFVREFLAEAKRSGDPVTPVLPPINQKGAESQRLGKLAGYVFKQTGTLEEILAPFAALESPPTAAAGAASGTQMTLRSKPKPQSSPDIGVPPSSDVREQPMFASSPVTFNSLLRTLTSGEIHFLIHLKTLLDETTEAEPATAAGAAGASSSTTSSD